MVTGRKTARSTLHAVITLVLLTALAALVPSACGGGSSKTSSPPSPAPSGSASAGPAEPGQLVWKFKTGGGIASSPAVADGVVYVGSEDGYLYAVDIQSGQERWKFLTGGPIAYSPGPTGSSLAAAGGTIYCRSSDGYLYAVDLQSGQQRWKFKVGSASGYGSSPAVAGGEVYVASHDRLYALDGRTGRTIWTAKTGSEYSPAASGRMVYLGTRHGLQAFNAATGKKLWAYRPWRQGVSSNLVVSHGMVYGRTAGWISAVWAVDAQNGRDWWSLPADPPAPSSPTVSGGVAYFTGSSGVDDERRLRAVDAQSGKDIWASDAGWDDAISPAASGGLVCVTGGKTLFAVDARTGDDRWQFETGGSITASPAISNSLVFVGSDDGYLYAVASGSRPAVAYAESPVLPREAWAAPTVGWQFKPSVDIEVTELGCFDADQDGLANLHRVGMFDARTERLLAHVIVRPNSMLDGFFRWESLERPVVLKAGHRYVVGTQTEPRVEDEEQGHETLYDENSPGDWASEIAYGGLRTNLGSDDWAPTNPDQLFGFTKHAWMSPNFMFMPVSASSPTP